MTPAEHVVNLLGGPGVLQLRELPDAAEVRSRIQKGLPFCSFETVRARLRLSVPELAAVLHMPLRTMARRRQARRLDAEESDRLYRMARVAGQAMAVFGSEDKAAIWLQRPNRALNGELPVRMLDTDLGARQVEDILGRIEYGIVA